MAVRRIQTLASPWACQGGPSGNLAWPAAPGEDALVTGSYRWLPDTAPPPETVPAVGAPCVYIWESILEVGIWNRGNQSRLELASTALLPTPEPGNQSDTKQGASAPPSPECLFHPHQGLQGGTPEWSPGSPLSPFKCTRQPTWTSDQILNGVQIMQQRRLFYWGGGRKGSIWSCCISRLWSLVKKLMSVWRVSSE